MTQAAKNSSVDAKPQKTPGFMRRWASGFVRDQKAMAFSDRQKEFLVETGAAYKRVLKLRVVPGNVETFEAAVRRQNLSPAQLASQFTKFRAVHLSLYAISGALIVYSLYLTLNYPVYFGLGALIASLGALSNGYLYGFRAWQIQNRSLIRLQDALRAIDTYLVL